MTMSRKGKGDCFVVALELITDNPEFRDAVLCHGVVIGQKQLTGVSYAHAWLEMHGAVIDQSNGREIIMPKFLYYALGCIEPDKVFTYTAREAWKKSLEYGTYGPWDFKPVR